MIGTNLYCANVLLNPYHINNYNLHNNVDVKSGLLWGLRKLVNHNDEYNTLKKGRGAYTNMPNIAQSNLKPHKWWDLVGKGGPMLMSIAKKILSQVCSVSLCEQNWLIYCSVHSKSQN